MRLPTILAIAAVLAAAVTAIPPPDDEICDLRVVLLSDNTGSMGLYISNVQASASAILGAMNDGPGDDVRFGVAGYRDIYDSPNYQRFESPPGDATVTTNVGIHADRVSQLFASGGDDYPEDALRAMINVCNEFDSDFGAGDDTTRFIVLYTDAPTWFRGAAINDWFTACHDRNVRIITFATPFSQTTTEGDANWSTLRTLYNDHAGPDLFTLHDLGDPAVMSDQIAAALNEFCDLCGNGVVDAGEECDPADVDGPPCTEGCLLVPEPEVPELECNDPVPPYSDVYMCDEDGDYLLYDNVNTGGLILWNSFKWGEFLLDLHNPAKGAYSYLEARPATDGTLRAHGKGYSDYFDDLCDFDFTFDLTPGTCASATGGFGSVTCGGSTIDYIGKANDAGDEANVIWGFRFEGWLENVNGLANANWQDFVAIIACKVEDASPVVLP